MNDLQRSSDLRKRLKEKMGFTQEAEKPRIEIPDYAEAKSTGDIQGMLKAKLYKSNYAYEATRQELEGKGINSLRVNKKALERRIQALEEQEEKELEVIENEIALQLEAELKECRNDLTRNITISNYLKIAEERKEEAINKYCNLNREYSLQLKAYEDKEQEFLAENRDVIEKLKKEKLEKEIRDMIALEEIENINNFNNIDIQEEEQEEEEN